MRTVNLKLGQIIRPGLTIQKTQYKAIIQGGIVGQIVVKYSSIWVYTYIVRSDVLKLLMKIWDSVYI